MLLLKQSDKYFVRESILIVRTTILEKLMLSVISYIYNPIDAWSVKFRGIYQ